MFATNRELALEVEVGRFRRDLFHRISAVVVTVPPLRDAFNFGTLHPLDWVVAVVAGLVSVSWFELFKIRASRLTALTAPSDTRPSPSART